MKAIQIHTYGGPEVLQYEDAPIPTPGPGEVLLRVHAAAVNPVDVKIRAGLFRGYRLDSLPLILGWDVSGVVEAADRNVVQWKSGDSLFGHLSISRNGSYAEYVTIHESQMASKPTSVDHVHAAAIPLTALTAYQAILELGDVKAGQTVLIHGAAGGVGRFAVQFAKLRGARVIGTASTGNQAFLMELGVDIPIDYEHSVFEDVVGEVDLILDSLGGFTRERSWKLLRPGGILVSIVNPMPSRRIAQAHKVRAELLWVRPHSGQLQQIGKLVDEGCLVSHVAKVFSLVDAQAAHKLIEVGHGRGKIVLQVG